MGRPTLQGRGSCLKAALIEESLGDRVIDAKLRAPWVAGGTLKPLETSLPVDGPEVILKDLTL